MSKRLTRGLAAVMFTDVVGYTSVMQEDEEGARVVRGRHRQALRLILPLLLLALASGCGGSGPVEGNQPLVLEPKEFCRDHPDESIVTFEDSRLESNVRVHLSAGTGENITCAMLSSLDAFSAGGWAFHAPPGSGFRRIGIESIAGIQNLTGLSRLSLQNNDIEDIGLLAGLSDLTTLNLQRNNVVDIDPLTQLTSLTDLRLAGRAPLVGATRAVFLQDGVCEGPVDGPANTQEGPAEQWGLHGVPISQRAPPIGGYNYVGDLDALSGLTRLKFLTAGSDGTTDISVLAALTDLECLALSGTLTPDIGVLSVLTNLRELELFDAGLSDISPVGSLTGLTALHLSTNTISDLDPLAGLTGLREVGLAENLVGDISVLSDLTNLVWVDLSSNPLSDIQPLVDNPGVGAGDVVIVRSVGVACPAGVSLLEARGVAVLSDC